MISLIHTKKQKQFIVNFVFFSFREVIESQTGQLPEVSHTNCRCPESHPRISPTNLFHCMKNGAETSPLVERLSKESHVPEYMVDGEAITYWISEQVNDVFIEIDLKYSKLQVFFFFRVYYRVSDNINNTTFLDNLYVIQYM